MGTRIATAVGTGAALDAARAIVSQLKDGLGGDDPALVMVFSSTEQPLGEVMSTVASEFPRAKLLGSSTAGEFTERGDAKGAVTACAVAGDYQVYAGMSNGLRADYGRAVEHAMSDIPSELPGYPYRTATLLLDPLAGNGEETTLTVAACLGPDVKLAGGAAGDDLNMKSTHVALGTRVESDAVLVGVIFSKAPLGVGVSHAHSPISPPLTVTQSEGNVVSEVDGRRAWDVWAEHTKERASRCGLDPTSLPKDKEGMFLLRYEAGLASGEEYKIRAPLSRNQDGSLNFACGIPQGATIQITESEPEGQVESARLAARRALEGLEGRKAAGAVVFDCICRQIILGDRFGSAVQEISRELGGVPVAGFETYGEIALDVGDMSGFHNTTSVVLAFPE